MKKYLFLFLSVFLLFNPGVKGQFKDKLDRFFGIRYHKGYAVLNNGDTLKGEIIFNNDYTNYQNLGFRDSLTTKKTFYKPQEVKLFSIDSSFFYPKIFRNDWVFMCLVLDDSLKIYLYRYFMATPYTSGTETSYFYEKPDGQYLQVLPGKMFPFKKRVGAFFSDYPELSEKIDNKTYKFEDLLVIANQYNTWLRQKDLKK